MFSAFSRAPQSTSARPPRRPAPRVHRGRKSSLHLETLEDRTLLSGAPVGNLVIFGDSLADAGNVSLATGGAIPNSAIYSQGRFSSGPIWVDTLAKYLGQPAVQPSLAGGLDYAFGGATVADSNPPAPFNTVPMLSQQVGLYLAGHTPASNDLIAVWAGANDFFDTLPSPTGPISPFQSADALESSLDTLATAGARQFVVANLPPLGETPFIKGLGIPGLSAAADQWTSAFNAELNADLGKLQTDHPGVTVVSVDVAGLFQQINQPHNSFGFVNTTDPVGPLAPGSVFLTSVTATNSQNYLFFDGVHPTSKGHQLVGLEAAAGVYAALGIHDLVVTSTTDTVDPLAHGLSLREMVNLANNLPGATSITFNLGAGAHQIKLGGQDLALTGDMVISGPSKGELSISGQGKSRIFDVGPDAFVTLSHVTLTGGAADKGGAIANAGQLELDDVKLRGNTAHVGGAIYNTGVLTIDDSLLASNSVSGGSFNIGGALANVGPAATASLFNTLLLNNSARGDARAVGGAIANLEGAHLDVMFSLLAGNMAYGAEAWGGGIFSDSSSMLSLEASLLIGNRALGKDAKGGHGLGGGLYLGQGSDFQMSDTFIEGNFASTKGPNVYQAP